MSIYRTRAGTRLFGRASLAALAALAAAPSYAQTENAPADPASAGLEDIVVTAQKREENLQRVPVAVTALSSDSLERMRIVNVSGLGAIVPNFQVQLQPSNAALPVYSLRGVLGGETTPQLDNGVSLYVDGVYLGRSSGTLFDVADIARIEVLRGPQGTLFGRNTTGGAVNLITRAPPGDFGIKQELSYGRFNDFRAKTRIDLPALGPISASITYQHRETDGYVKNLSAGVVRDYTAGTNGLVGRAVAAKTLGERNADSVFAAVRFDDGGRFVADYKFDYTDFEGSQQAFQLIGLRGAADLPGTNPLGGTMAFILSLQPGLGGTNVISTRLLDAVNEPQRATDTLRAQGHSLTMSYELSDQVTVKNIAAYRKLKQVANGNSFDGNHLIDPFGGTGNDFTVLDAVSNRKQKQFSNELQFIGDGDRFDWTAGAFYFNEKATDVTEVMFFKVFPPAGGSVDITPADHFANVRIRNSSAAIYGQGTLALTGQLRLTAGVRQTWDKRKEVNFLTTPTTTGKADFDKLTYQGVLEYQATPDVMFYGKISTGYLSGGIYNGKSFEPESLRAYEIGMKGEFFDNMLRFNLAGFVSDYKNLQVSVFTTVLNYENAGSARIKGLEAEATLVPVRGLTISANLGYLDFKYKEYISSLLSGTPEDISDFAVRPLSPKITFAPSIRYETLPTAGGSYLSFAVDANYRSDTKFALSPFADPALDRAATSQARWIVNGRISAVDIPVGASKVKVSLWGENLFNRRVIDYVSDVSGIVAGSFNRPRAYGIDASVEF